MVSLTHVVLFFWKCLGFFTLISSYKKEFYDPKIKFKKNGKATPYFSKPPISSLFSYHPILYPPPLNIQMAKKFTKMFVKSYYKNQLKKSENMNHVHLFVYCREGISHMRTRVSKKKELEKQPLNIPPIVADNLGHRIWCCV